MYLAEVVRWRQKPSRSPDSEERRGCCQEDDEAHPREKHRHNGRMICLGEAGRQIQIQPLKPGDKRKQLPEFLATFFFHITYAFLMLHSLSVVKHFMFFLVISKISAKLYRSSCVPNACAEAQCIKYRGQGAASLHRHTLLSLSWPRFPVVLSWCYIHNGKVGRREEGNLLLDSRIPEAPT